MMTNDVGISKPGGRGIKNIDMDWMVNLVNPATRATNGHFFFFLFSYHVFLVWWNLCVFFFVFFCFFCVYYCIDILYKMANF